MRVPEIVIQNRLVPVASSAPEGLAPREESTKVSVLQLFFPPQQQAGPDELFKVEKAAFASLLPYLHRSYGARFVAVHGGIVVDADTSRNALIRRFLNRFGRGASVYIGFVGPRPIVRVPTPFIRRKSQ